ncbi:MAG: pyridoxine 5'-phosphate synthase [Nitrospinaceae bacterium]
MIRLYVNVDHVATVREARKTVEPDPLKAALLAERAGADGITIHLREDRRHIQDHDLERIRSSITTPLNLEMAPVEEMVVKALETRPCQVSLVPEKRQEITTEGGLDVCSQEEYFHNIREKLKAAGIRFSLFIDPDPDQVEAAARIGADSMEINTGCYSELKGEGELTRELTRIQVAARMGSGLGLRVFAGHGLNYENVVSIAAIPEIEELNIGHYLVAQAIYSGLEKAVQEMIQAIQKGVEKRSP